MSWYFVCGCSPLTLKWWTRWKSKLLSSPHQPDILKEPSSYHVSPSSYCILPFLALFIVFLPCFTIFLLCFSTIHSIAMKMWQFVQPLLSFGCWTFWLSTMSIVFSRTYFVPLRWSLSCSLQLLDSFFFGQISHCSRLVWRAKSHQQTQSAEGHSCHLQGVCVCVFVHVVCLCVV